MCVRVLTKGIIIPNLGPPTAHEMYSIFLQSRHLRVPLSDQLRILVHFVRLDVMKHNRMHILSPRKHLRERAFKVAVQLLPLFGAVDETRQRAPFLGFRGWLRFVRLDDAMAG